MRDVGAGLADKLSISEITLLQNPPLQPLIFHYFV